MLAMGRKRERLFEEGMLECVQVRESGGWERWVGVIGDKERGKKNSEEKRREQKVHPHTAMHE